MPFARSGVENPAVDPITTRTFHLLSCATPRQVWEALTSPELSPRFLHGLTARSCWRTGSDVALTSALDLDLTGRVLYSEAPRRLTWTIEDPSSCTYLTWDLRPARVGTVVRLTVEESDASDDEDLEDTWLPALAALEQVLQG
jgi:uncharacterized protein YndB with AHSA1/START domain